jgi:hypothetical protein
MNEIKKIVLREVPVLSESIIKLFSGIEKKVFTYSRQPPSL